MSRSRPPRYRYSAVMSALLLTALLAVALVLVRLTFEARAALRSGDEHLAQGGSVEAVGHYLDAARAHYPGNPYANAALDRLMGLSEAKEGAAASDEVKRAALEAFRAAVLASRSVYVPRARDLARTNESLADVYARWEMRGRGGHLGHAAELAQRRDWHLQKLVVLPGPSLIWSCLALAGMAIWVGAVVAFITRALTPNMKVIRAPALGAGLAFVFGLLLFLFGLAR